MNISKDLSRFFLFALIAGLVLTLLKQWVNFSSDYDAAAIERLNQEYGQDLPTDPIDVVDFSQNEIEPNIKAINAPSETNPIVDNKDITSGQPINSSRNIVIETDTIKVVIDSLGGDIIEVALLKHQSKQEENAKPLLLLEKSRKRTYYAQSGLSGPSGTEDKYLKARFSSSSSNYKTSHDLS